MVDDNIPKIYKFIIIGESVVGKSDILYHLKNHKYNTKEDEKHSTIGLDYLMNTINEINRPHQTQIWDLSGAPRFRAMTKAYCRNALGAIVCFDLTKKKTFEALGDWISSLKSICDIHYQILLLGNKNDLDNQIEVNQEEIEHLVKQNSNMTYFPCSAKTGDNIFESLYFFIRKIYCILVNKNSKKKKLRFSFEK